MSLSAHARIHEHLAAVNRTLQQVTACSDEVSCAPGWSRIEEAWRADYLANERERLREFHRRYAQFMPDSTLAAEWRKLAPDGGIFTCFPCAEGTCCGCLQRRRRFPWPPFSALGGCLWRVHSCHAAKFLHSGSRWSGSARCAASPPRGTS